jgi:hypothetical protein
MTTMPMRGGMPRTSKLALLALLAAAAWSAPRALAAQATHPDSSLQRDLLRLAAEDGAERAKLRAAVLREDFAFLRRFLAADSLRSEWLKVVVAERGWPGRAAVGDAGVKAAWSLLQHSSDAAFQARMLPDVERAAQRGELSPAEVAMMTDRVLVKTGRPQRYGTSFTERDGRLVADSIEDRAGLEARRAAKGMPPMADYARMLGELYGRPVDWPRD